jgi:hypothetical protein
MVQRRRDKAQKGKQRGDHKNCVVILLLFFDIIHYHHHHLLTMATIEGDGG